MENRDRDKVSRNNTGPTEAGDLNRDTSSRIGNENDDSTSEFGQNIGRSENLEEPNRRGEKIGNDNMGSNIGENISERGSGRTSGTSSRSEH